MTLLRYARISCRAALLALGVLAAFGAGSGLAPAGAQSSVKILVNDEPITSFDIQNRTKMLSVFTGGKQGEKDAIEQLVDEQLMMQEAKLRSMSVSDEEVDAEFARRAKSSKLTPEQFRGAFRQAGVDAKTFTNFLRANMTWGKIIRARFQATVKVSEQDVVAALKGRETEGAPTTVAEYMLQPIVFIVPEKAAGGVEAQMQGQATSFRGAFQGCDSSLQQASGVAGIVVKPSIRRDESQMSDALKKEIAEAGVGGITTPQRVAEGFQMLGICEKNDVAGRTGATEEVRSELADERGQLLARRYLRDLRSDAVIDYR